MLIARLGSVCTISRAQRSRRSQSSGAVTLNSSTSRPRTAVASGRNASAGASKGFEGSSVYSASKVAIRSFVRTWTVDLKQRKIRVNAISPGPIDTPMLSGLVHREKNLVSTVPLGRMGSPDEIAKVATFLASDDSSYVTGIELFVDWGWAQI